MKDSQKQASRIKEAFGSKVEHVSGNMFRVSREIINFAKEGICSVDGKLVYGNPRWFINRDGKPEAKGIERGKMEELKNSIKDRGVDHPIRLRATENSEGEIFLEVVNGERRLRAISDLCDSDVNCIDSLSGEMRPSTEVYDQVECRIEFMDDANALCCALQLNETSEIIGDAANINVVKVLRDSGYDEPEILKATGKSLSWLREIDQLIGLDETCLQDYQSEKINKQVALRLALIKDVEERVARLEKIKQVAEERHLEKIRQSQQKVEDALKEAEQAEMDEFEENVERANNGEDEKISKSRKKAKNKVERIKQKLQEISSATVTAKSKDADAAEGSSKPLSHSKIEKKLLRVIRELIDNDGLHEETNFDVSSLVMIEAILEAILSGNSDIVSILHEHCQVVSDEVDIEASDSDEEEEVDIEASDSDEEEEDDIEASDSDEEEEDDIEASDSDEEEEDDIEASDSDEEDKQYSYIDSSDSDEIDAELEKEFEDELRAMDRDY